MSVTASYLLTSMGVFWQCCYLQWVLQWKWESTDFSTDHSVHVAVFNIMLSCYSKEGDECAMVLWWQRILIGSKQKAIFSYIGWPSIHFFFLPNQITYLRPLGAINAIERAVLRKHKLVTAHITEVNNNHLGLLAGWDLGRGGTLLDPQTTTKPIYTV